MDNTLIEGEDFTAAIADSNDGRLDRPKIIEEFLSTTVKLT